MGDREHTGEEVPNDVSDERPTEATQVAERIAHLELWLIDHHDRPRVAQALRTAERLEVEHQLDELRAQRQRWERAA